MPHIRTALRPLILALCVTLAQVFVAVALIAPEGPLWWRYTTLVQHDSYWFANIVDRGYDTTVPPISHKMMEVSNVAFFPAYPAMAAVVRRVFGVGTYDALLITAQAAAFGFWSYFFLLCERWGISPLLQFFGATAILSHPVAFFLVAAYSESLFLFGVIGFIYWSTSARRGSGVLAIVNGIVMSATRIVGLPCAAIPIVIALFRSGLTNVSGLVRGMIRPAILMAGAMLGGIGFFIYCAARWGRWDMYMLTQQAGWGIEPDYLALFKPSSYHWQIPHINDPVTVSQLTMAIGAVLFLAIGICELLPALRRKTQWQTRIGIYFAAFVIYYISISGVASVAMESMMRYDLVVHALIVLAFLHFLHQLPTPRRSVRALGMAATALLCAGGLSLQGWWIWNFTRGNWVA